MRVVASLLTFCLLCCTSCNYQLGNCTWASSTPTMRVPYVEGDKLGHLTAALVKELSKSGQACYRDCEAQYELRAFLVDCREQNLGYRYDERGERGERRRRVVPTEARVSVFAEVTVVDLSSCTEVLGPTLVSASAEYDFDLYANHSEENIFSLGQVNDREVSRDLVLRPLYQNLAKNIVDYVTNTW